MLIIKKQLWLLLAIAGALSLTFGLSAYAKKHQKHGKKMIHCMLKDGKMKKGLTHKACLAIGGHEMHEMHKKMREMHKKEKH